MVGTKQNIDRTESSTAHRAKNNLNIRIKTQGWASKDRNVLAFFSILYKTIRRSLRSFAFFIKVRNIICALLLSL